MPANTVSTIRPAGLVVRPGLAQGAQPGAGLAQLLGDLEQVTGRASQAVEAVDHDHVGLAHLVEQAGELRPITPGTGELLLVDPPAAGLFRAVRCSRRSWSSVLTRA